MVLSQFLLALTYDSQLLLIKTLVPMAQAPTMEEADVSKCETNIKVEGQNEYQTPDFESPDDVPDQNAQDGVRIAEAMTLSWSRSSLIVVYIRQVPVVSPPEVSQEPLRVETIY